MEADTKAGAGRSNTATVAVLKLVVMIIRL